MTRRASFLRLSWRIGLCILGACARPEPGRVTRAEPRERSAPSSGEPSLALGSTLYATHCVVCHGATGDGRGPAAYLLSPLPRDFTTGRFRLVSTENAVPSQADLVAVLRRGMPGSAMPAFDWMSEAERGSLALHVRALARAGIVEGLRRYAAEEGEDFDEAEAQEIALRQTTPGAAVELGVAPPDSAGLRARGQELYAASCAPCHGADGRAREVDVQWNEDGTPTRPRDFTAGIFKGEPTREAIVQRLLCGLPGSPMPATELAQPTDPWALASYVQSLVRPGAGERVVQKRQTVAARRTRTLPDGPADAAWERAPAAELALMPLWWRDERIETVEVRALHDGRRIAFQLRWKDSSKDDELLGTETFSDLAALQLSAEPDPPLFAMGDLGRPVDLWAWRAGWERDADGPRDVRDRYPNLSADLYGHQPEEAAPLFLTARATGNPVAADRRAQAGELLTAQGLGTVQPPAGGAASLDARGLWKDGAWRVAFTRAMAGSGGVALTAGTQVHLAAAVWDGRAEDRNGQKSVTVWHVLEIER
jgi:DMSO reductase family type II enzyme heme b subunit